MQNKTNKTLNLTSSNLKIKIKKLLISKIEFVKVYVTILI